MGLTPGKGKRQYLFSFQDCQQPVGQVLRQIPLMGTAVPLLMPHTAYIQIQKYLECSGRLGIPRENRLAVSYCC